MASATATPPAARPSPSAKHEALAAAFHTRLAGEVRRVASHRDFAAARTLFCTGVADFWQTSRLHRDLVADTGGIALVITLTGLARQNPAGGAPAQRLIDGLASHGLASPTRARSLIRLLQAQGAIEMLFDPADRRRRLLRPSPLLNGLHRDWLAANLAATELVSDLPLPSRQLADTPGLVETYLTEVMRRHVRDGFTVFTDFPEVAAFMDHRGGYMLMLALAGADAGFSRSGLARASGVSRAHLAALLAQAQARGWVLRQPPRHEIALAPPFSVQISGWIARELALFSLFAADHAGSTCPEKSGFF
jgi:hypothetical protein